MFPRKFGTSYAKRLILLIREHWFVEYRGIFSALSYTYDVAFVKKLINTNL